MTMPRRDFVKTSSAAALALAASPGLARVPRAKKPLRILFLGGTGFLGPHMVERAIAAGHQVTLFNRGRTNPHLFPDAEKLEGDRYGDISALEGREWDAVIDTFTYVPATVARTAELLKDKVGQYLVVSTISVYANYATPGMDESGELATVSDEIAAGIESHTQVGQYYGPMKARCEKTVEEIMPGRTCVVRPGLIVGPGDPTDRFTWWPARVAKGGEVLAPGKPEHYTQSIDVRDLADFIVTCTERKNMGTYNADSPGATRTMGLLLETCRAVSGSDAAFTWVPAEFLSAHGVGAWQHMTCWVPPEGDYLGFGQISTARATANGLKIRPLSETVRDTLAWINETPEDPELLARAVNRRERLPMGERAGVSPEKEAEVLKAWHEANG